MFVPDEREPLSDSCARPADLRHPVGTRDAFLIGEPSDGAGHPHHRDAPRLVVEWDGRAWQPVAIADSWAAAHQMIVGDGRPPVFPQVSGRLPVFRPGPSGRRAD